MDAHLQWVAQNRSWVHLAGSLREIPDTPPVGALLVVESESKDEILDHLKSDPFWANGLRQGVDIFVWGLASTDMKTAISNISPNPKFP